ncbi:MAG: LapA family protein [Rhodospirillales bacterium]|nr:LapA family protein [Rhodospirillales bacterium]
MLIGFWPFGVASAWLGPVVIAALALGFFVGLLTTVPKHLRWRRRAYAAEKRVAELSAPAGNVHPNGVQPTILK